MLGGDLHHLEEEVRALEPCKDHLGVDHAELADDVADTLSVAVAVSARTGGRPSSSTAALSPR